MFRLHHENFVQGSLYVRNILRQTGPLYLQPEKRSDTTPSFRIIDFGRSSHLEDGEGAPWDEWQEAKRQQKEEQKRARSELLLEPYGIDW